MCSVTACERFGSASSVVLHGDSVVVCASVECEAIIAYDKKSQGAKAYQKLANELLERRGFNARDEQWEVQAF